MGKSVLSLRDLQKYCKKQGIEFPQSATKAQLAALIAVNDGIEFSPQQTCYGNWSSVAKECRVCIFRNQCAKLTLQGETRLADALKRSKEKQIERRPVVGEAVSKGMNSKVRSEAEIRIEAFKLIDLGQKAGDIAKSLGVPTQAVAAWKAHRSRGTYTKV